MSRFFRLQKLERKLAEVTAERDMFEAALDAIYDDYQAYCSDYVEARMELDEARAVIARVSEVRKLCRPPYADARVMLGAIDNELGRILDGADTPTGEWWADRGPDDEADPVYLGDATEPDTSVIEDIREPGQATSWRFRRMAVVERRERTIGEDS